MPSHHRLASPRGLIVLLALGLIATSGARGQDTATLNITSDGPQIRVDLRGPAVALIGFEHAPRTAEQRETLALAVHNLRAGDGLIRFNAQAGCRLEETGIDEDPAPNGESPGELGARYRFHCGGAQAPASAALGLFMGFPALVRAHVRYEVAGAAGEAILTPGNPVVTFVPFR